MSERWREILHDIAFGMFICVRVSVSADVCVCVCGSPAQSRSTCIFDVSLSIPFCIVVYRCICLLVGLFIQLSIYFSPSLSFF